ncbi:MAG: glycoside hydrolase family 15 protein [Actinomycetota bacterium]
MSRSELPYPSISDYALLSDCHSAALVSKDGGVDWCCFHRFDARPVFARVLDWNKGGHFRIAPKDSYSVSRRYLPATFILETRFVTRRGVLVVVDCLPVRGASDPTTAEGVHPYHQLLRLIRCEAGAVELVIEFCPRFEYGLTVPQIEMAGEDVGIVYGGPDALIFQSELPLAPPKGGSCRAEALLTAGNEVFAALTYAVPHELRIRRLGAAEVAARVETTGRFWSRWSSRCTYRGPYREQVLRSALVLKALTNAPSGAIVAAPTTSLPEQIGGVRNWDYRFTWLRDSALDLYCLFRLGYTEEADAFMRWIRRTTAGRAEELQIMYGVDGESLLPEFELPGLDGYRGSRPVRIGNAASTQSQLDVYGYLLDTAWLYHRYGGKIDNVFWGLLASTVDLVARRWTEPDQGIWEVRGGPRHFVSSKVMAWVAVDRGIRLARTLGLPGDLKAWRQLRADIRSSVESKGVNPETGTFVQAFGSTALDASTLLIPLVGFLRVQDPRVRATFEAIEKNLTVEGLTYRYLGPDGLVGGEGAFLICGFWLADNLALAGELRRARTMFERLAGYGNDLGLMSEEIDPATGASLGNFPQAFSHVGLIGAAINLAKASGAPESGSPPSRSVSA